MASAALPFMFQAVEIGGDAYKDILMIAVLFPILALVLLVILGSMFGAF